jgi:hypothetical protein
MVEKAPALVHLWIDAKRPVSELQQLLAERLHFDLEKIKKLMGKDTPGTATVAGEIQGLRQVKVGDRMLAELDGNEFDYSPKGPTPGLLDGSIWKWQWQVTPKRASETGPFILTIKAWDPSRNETFPSINEPVLVEAVQTPITWVKRLTEWLKAIEDLYKALAALALILLPLALAFRKRLGRILRSWQGTD